MTTATRTHVAPDSGQRAALDVARQLAASGVPVFLARPALDDSGQWNPAAGAGGYWLPRGWQTTEADPATLDDWQPGMAVCAVTGGPLDLLDTDPRSGGDTSRAELERDGLLPRVWLAATTPSGGTHEWVAHLGVHSRDNLRPGLDVKAGHDGNGRGFAFIAPTVKLSKSSGQLASYGVPQGDYLHGTGTGWERTEGDTSGELLAQAITEARGYRRTATGDDTDTEADEPAPAFAELPPETQDRVQRWTLATVAAVRAELEGAQQWAEAERDARGRGWERLCADAAWKLARLALADWCPLTMRDARQTYLDSAPSDSVDWTADKVREKWRAQKASANRYGPWPWQDSFDRLDVDEAEILADDASPAADERAAFWESRPFLRAVRDFAHSRRVGRWALLGCVLARISAHTPPSVVLPPLIGGVAPLNLFVALCSGSGGGKTAAMAAAADFLAAERCGLFTPFLKTAPGSGEGLVASYVSSGSQPNVSTLVVADEIQSLEKLATRSGSTLVPFLKQAWAGTTLATLNAEASRNRRVEAHRYRLAMVAGVQPVNAGTILDDEHGGFPQRWLWMPTYDAELPGPLAEVPDAQPYQWTPAEQPVTGEFDAQGELLNVTDPQQIVLGVPDVARVAILTANHARNHRIGTAPAGEGLDGHRLQSQERVAALLALADGRADAITEQDWNLAGVVLAVSDETRADVVRERSRDVQQRNIARGRAEGVRAAEAAETAEAVHVTKAGRWATKWLREHDGPHAFNELNKAAGSRYREHLREALDALVLAGQVTMETVEYRGQTGESYQWAGGAA